MSQSGSTTGVLTGLAQTLELVVEGLGVGGVNVVVDGLWNGTLEFEGTMSRSGAPVWFSLTGTDLSTLASTARTAVAGNFQFDVSALSRFRMRVSVFVAGTATPTLQGSEV